jgi:hypothetical protein
MNNINEQIITEPISEAYEKLVSCYSDATEFEFEFFRCTPHFQKHVTDY